MNNSFTQRKTAIAFVGALILIGSGAIVGVKHSGATAVFGEHRVYTGYVSSTAVLTQGWHAASATQPALWAVDIGQAGDPSGMTMRYLSEHRSGSASMDAFRFGPGGSTTCTGAEIWLQENTTGAIIGEVRYIHVNVGAGVPAFWTVSANNGFTAMDIGTNAATQPATCVQNFIPHLHQADELLPPKNGSVPLSLPIGHPNSWLFDYVW